MAYVPDIAINRMDELSGKAFKLYTYYCMRADADGQCFPGLTGTARDLGWTANHTAVRRKELIDSGWIVQTESGIRLLVWEKTRKKGSKDGTDSVPVPVSDSLETGSKDSTKTVLAPVSGSTKTVLAASTKTVASKYKNCTTGSTKTVLAIKEEPAHLTSPSNQPMGGAKRKRGVKTPVAEPFVVTDSMRAWAEGKAPEASVERETEKFVNHALANGRECKDWEAAWRNWMLRAAEFNGARNGQQKVVGSAAPQPGKYANRR